MRISVRMRVGLRWVGMVRGGLEDGEMGGRSRALATSGALGRGRQVEQVAGGAAPHDLLAELFEDGVARQAIEVGDGFRAQRRFHLGEAAHEKALAEGVDKVVLGQGGVGEEEAEAAAHELTEEVAGGLVKGGDDGAVWRADHLHDEIVHRNASIADPSQAIELGI